LLLQQTLPRAVIHSKHIHIAGVGGVVTSALAAELVRLGYRVTGSDEYVLPPADAVLANSGLAVADGYHASQVEDTVDLAVLNTVLKPENPVVGEILRRRIPHLGWARLLAELGLLERRNGVVAGTNGKTTTSCMWAWIMEQNGRQPDYVIGGQVAPWHTGVRLRGAEFCVLEGDEFPSSLGDRNPKFAYYRPEVAALLNVHYDHSDVFSSEREVVQCYRMLVDLMPPDGLLIYNHDDPHCRKLASHAVCRTASFGHQNGAAHPLRKFKTGPQGCSFILDDVSFSLPQWGRMNATNAAAAILGAAHWGLSLEESADALRSFPGALKRQHRLRADDRLVFLTDTAYHPEAVKALLTSLHHSFPGRPLGLVLQPRYTTGSQNWQQKRWPAALRSLSKLVLLGSLNHPDGATNHFSSTLLHETLLQQGIQSRHASNDGEATEAFRDLVAPGDVWVMCLEEWFPQPRQNITEWALQL
jgi:UDP-N-acetylmuramate: L-alanyl-gamma-D-glutamyl-meso-diaminopimelate ligase